MDKLILDESKAVLREDEVLPAVELTGPVTSTQTVVDDNISPDVEKNAYKDLINSSIKLELDANSNLTSVIATFTDSKYKEALDILNTILDEKTVQIGMLNKILEMIDGKTEDLLDQGQQKAEDITGEPGNELNK